ncbi:hypothetical protein [Leptodesmis sp.]|uniref:hypothetical protein n=1 Tax=Leptodesmis sp. TaxID=3100501 RepID=UPI0040535B24
MGRRRITQLLDQLQANQEADLQNAAAIFTVAQVAVSQLEQQTSGDSVEIAALPPTTPMNKEELRQRYGSHHACRNAAKQKGIHFQKTPTWEELAEAFTYFEAFENLIQDYLKRHPPGLRGVSMQFRIG